MGCWAEPDADDENRGLLLNSGLLLYILIIGRSEVFDFDDFF